MDFLARYLSGYPTSKCLCKSMASIKTFATELLIRTRPHLNEESRSKVCYSLIERAVKELNKENAYIRKCCVKQKSKVSPKVILKKEKDVFEKIKNSSAGETTYTKTVPKEKRAKLQHKASRDALVQTTPNVSKYDKSNTRFGNKKVPSVYRGEKDGHTHFTSCNQTFEQNVTFPKSKVRLDKTHQELLMDSSSQSKKKSGKESMWAAHRQRENDCDTQFRHISSSGTKMNTTTCIETSTKITPNLKRMPQKQQFSVNTTPTPSKSNRGSLFPMKTARFLKGNTHFNSGNRKPFCNIENNIVSQSRNTEVLATSTPKGCLSMKQAEDNTSCINSPKVTLVKVPIQKRLSKKLPFTYEVKYTAAKSSKAKQTTTEKQQPKALLNEHQTPNALEKQTQTAYQKPPTIEKQATSCPKKAETNSQDSIKSINFEKSIGSDANISLASASINPVDLLSGLNINLNITVNNGCNAPQPKVPENIVRYITKRVPKKTKPPPKIREVEEIDVDLYLTTLDGLESPVLLSRAASELDNLNTEFDDIQATINRLQYKNFEFEFFYMWDDFL